MEETENKKPVRMKKTVTEMNTSEGINSRVHEAEGRISDFRR